MQKTILLFYILLIAITSTGFAQNNKVDSILNLAETSQVDTSKVNYYQRAAQMLAPTDQDKAVKYALKAVKLGKEVKHYARVADAYTAIGIAKFYQGDLDGAIQNFDNSMNTHKSIDDQAGVAQDYLNKGIIYKATQQFNKAHDSYTKALHVYQKQNDHKNSALAFLNIGNLYTKQGNYPAALNNLFSSLKIFEQTNNKEKQAIVHSSLGSIYGTQKEHERAIESFKKAMTLYKETENISGQAESFNNIGLSYTETGRYHEAIEQFTRAVDLFTQVGFKSRIALSFYNIGDAHNKVNHFDTAYSYFQKALKINKETGDKAGLAYCYSGMGENFYHQDKYKMTVVFLEKANELSSDADIETQREVAEGLSKVYEKIEDFEKAYKNHVRFKKLNDSIFSTNNEKHLTRLEMQYSFDKEKRINELEHQKEIEHQQIFTWGAGIATVFMLFIAVIFIWGYRTKKKANTLLKGQKIQIEFKNSELNQQKEELEATTEELEKQRDLALTREKEITSSIVYAKRIQQAVLPSEQQRLEYIPKHFVYFKPRNIVSGDFFWMRKIRNKLVVIAADSTGHGVPGAFMSMLGVSLLNEIIPKQDRLQPHLILAELRSKIIQSLHQESKGSKTKDGMDMAIAVIDESKQSIDFAGAYNPLYHLTGEPTNPELNIVKAVRTPVGVHIAKPKDFTSNKISYKKGDRIYIFSDGYMDQFGGKKDRKLKTQGFKSLIKEIQPLSIDKQKQALDNFYSKWKGDRDQIDDLLIIGLELS
ncbi:MAG: tetratricopeptide repeat protein [Bacteroidota bacterium]|nr:tetratricopeptide repeat protein [Bacteroidota bacterium]